MPASDGQLRPDAEEVLTADALLAPDELGSIVRQQFARLKTDPDTLGGWQRIELAWMSNPRPLQEARTLLTARPEARLSA